MLLSNPQLISLFSDQVRPEDHIERNKNPSIGQKSNISKLKSPNPFKNPSIFIQDLPLLKIKLFAGILWRHFDERLIKIGGMINIFLKLKKTIHRRSKKLWMTQSITNILIFFLGLYWNIIFISFWMVIVLRHRSMQSLLLPFFNMLERCFCWKISIRDKTILIVKSYHILVINITTRKTKIR